MFALTSREANHEDAGRPRRRQGGSGVRAQAEGDREVDGGGVKAVGAALVLVFSDHVLQPVLLYWYHVYNIQFFFVFPKVICSVILPKWKKKLQRGWSLSSNWEMNILSLCNPLLSHLHCILDLNGIVDPQCD